MGVLSRHLHGPFQKLLGLIRKYFTCEGRFERLHSHHIRLLMHFMGRITLNMFFFLHQSLREMEDIIWAKADQPKRKISHVSRIKLLVVEELKWARSNWDLFFLIVGIPKDPKGDFPQPMERIISQPA
jgi:hypothetical protein